MRKPTGSEMEELLDRVLQVLERRIGELTALEEALREGEAAILESALDRIVQAQERQAEIGRRIGELDIELHSGFQALMNAVEPEGGLEPWLERLGPGVFGRSERAFRTHERVQLRVRALAGVQKALIRRSERTLRAMQSVMVSYSLRYGNIETGTLAGYGALQGSR